MLAQLLKNLYICTFFFVLVDRQKQEVVTQTAEVGHREKERKKKKKDPAHLTSHNYKPIPTPQKVKTVMQAPPHVEELRWGGRRKQNTNIKSVPVSTPYKNERNQS